MIAISGGLGRTGGRASAHRVLASGEAAALCATPGRAAVFGGAAGGGRSSAADVVVSGLVGEGDAGAVVELEDDDAVVADGSGAHGLAVADRQTEPR